MSHGKSPQVSLWSHSSSLNQFYQKKLSLLTDTTKKIIKISRICDPFGVPSFSVSISIEASIAWAMVRSRQSRHGSPVFDSDLVALSFTPFHLSVVCEKSLDSSASTCIRCFPSLSLVEAVLDVGIWSLLGGWQRWAVQCRSIFRRDYSLKKKLVNLTWDIK